MKLIFFAAISTCMIAIVNGDYRLNSSIIPEAYTIIITPYFDTGNELAFTFEGEVTITVETNDTDVNQITLHAQDLEFTAANITINNGSSNIGLNLENPLKFDDDYSLVNINLAVPMQIAIRYTLTISYKGPIRDDLLGLYRSRYVENGVTKWLGATQIGLTHARKVFPCFDEPEYKATFTLIIERPPGYKQSLANTKLQSSVELSNGYTRDIFGASPKMSSYLVAFLISEFETASVNSINETRDFGIYSRPDAVNQTIFATDFGQRAEAALSSYLGIDYYSTNPNLKLHHVAIPDFNYGAMENWGLINYRELAIMYVPEESTPAYKYRAAQILAHETAHMWFGNLVTCHWWSDAWLNEGFANYMENFITSKIEPNLGAEDMLVISSLYAAYTADGIPSAVSITNDDVASPSQINGHFGTITYQKAGSIIRMIHHLIGEDAFRFGLNYYLEEQKFGLGRPENVYAALQIGVNTYNSFLQYPNVQVADVMSSWVTQPGHPVLNVVVNYVTGEVHLTQKRFYLDSSYSSDEIYKVPITYTTKLNVDFENTKPLFIFEDQHFAFNIGEVSGEDSWIIFNIQETGFYRVSYDTPSWRRIAQVLKSEERTSIHKLNRAKIINDLFAFYNGEVVDFALLREVLDFLTEETDFSVWSAAVTGLNALRTNFFASEAFPIIENYSLDLMDNIIEKLGYIIRAEDDYLALRNRMLILEFACRLGHQKCIEYYVELFRNLKSNAVEIDPSFRPVAYCNGLRFGDGDDFDFLWSRMVSSNLANEIAVIQSALGCSRVEDKLKRYLTVGIGADSPIRQHDVTIPLTSVLADHSNADLLMGLLRDNYTQLSTAYPSMTTVVSQLVNAMHTNEQFAEFENWLSSCQDCSQDVITAGRSSLANARSIASWVSEHVGEIISVLSNKSVIATPSLIFTIITVLFGFVKQYLI